MANRHFARFADVWKHLPLLEILKLEPPREYWETHSGAALYPLTHSPDRDYGIYWFLDHANVEPILGRSRYRELLMTGFGDALPAHYPGSAELAMRQVGVEVTQYVLCETDRYSAESLREAAARNTLTDRVTVLEADGMDSLIERADGHPRPESVLVHIDPFDPYQPSPKNRVHAVELARRLSSRGFRVFYWYGFDVPAESGWAFSEISEDLESDIWFAEFCVDPESPRMLEEGTFLGCGVVCVNTHPTTTAHLEELGRALQRIYQESVLPAGTPGSLNFKTSGTPP